MNIGIYQGAASLNACEKWQGILSQNIASASVPGFRKTEASFASVLADQQRMDNGGRSPKEFKGVMPSSVTQFSLQQGELRSTNNELDFAIQGEGFFQIQRPNGQNGYTRDGQFRLNPERVLVTRQGFPLLGEGGPITLRPEGGRISINAEGSVIQGQQIVGKVAVYQIPGDQLERVGDGLLAPKDPAVQPGSIERPNVLNGYVEGSNVTPLNEMVNLIAVSRAYEASQRIITANDENADKAIQILGNPNA